MVQSEELNCSRGSIDFWEPLRDVTEEPTENAGKGNVKLPTLPSPMKLFAPAPAVPALGMAGASGGHMMFASSGGGSGRGGYDDHGDSGFDDDYDVDPVGEPDDEEPPRRPRSTRTVRSGGAASGGQSRVAQHQPEERYWTDYLRIALPVIGLLLMIGLLWYWATQLIGDSPETTDPATEGVGLVSEGTPPPTQPTVQIQEPTAQTGNGSTIGIGAGESTPESQPQETQPAQDPAAGDNQTSEPETEGETTGEEAATGGAYESGDPVVIIEDGVNVRPSASLEGDPITMLNTGDQLTIASGPVEGESYIWWEVILPSGDAGWVVEDFIEPAE